MVCLRVRSTGVWPALLLLAGGVSACRSAADQDPVILSLEGQQVRRSEFERHVHELEGRDGTPLAPAVRQALLEPFLEERIVVLEARRRGLLEPGSTPQEEQIAVGAMIDQTVQSQVQVSDAEIAAHYQAHRDELQAGESVRLRQILVPTRAEAQEIRQRLLKRPDEFESLARSRSRAPEADEGGLMGVFSRGQLPAELERPAFLLAPGALSEVVESSLGFHVLKVDLRTPARARGLEECREQIRALLSRRKADQGVRRFVQGLLSRAKVNHEAATVSARPS